MFEENIVIDSHAHVNFKMFNEDRDEVVENSISRGVYFIDVGTKYKTSVRAVELAQKYRGVWAAVGLHPIDVVKKKHDFETEDGKRVNFQSKGEVFDKEKYRKLAAQDEVVAIGEMGLDYHHFEEGDDIPAIKEIQKETFIKAIELANEVDKPMMIHCWDAYDDLFEILEKHKIKKGGVVHSFVSNKKNAKKFRELGFKLGFNGIITYSDAYDRLIQETSIEDILVETDCPYLTPLPADKENATKEEKLELKEKRNEPAMVSVIIQKVADIKGLSYQEVAKATTENAIKLFDLKVDF